jgi:hypothetical protein
MLIETLARVFGAEPFDATDMYGAVGGSGAPRGH